MTCYICQLPITPDHSYGIVLDRGSVHTSCRSIATRDLPDNGLVANSHMKLAPLLVSKSMIESAARMTNLPDNVHHIPHPHNDSQGAAYMTYTNEQLAGVAQIILDNMVWQSEDELASGWEIAAAYDAWKRIAPIVRDAALEDAARLVDIRANGLGNPGLMPEEYDRGPRAFAQDKLHLAADHIRALKSTGVIARHLADSEALKSKPTP